MRFLRRKGAFQTHEPAFRTTSVTTRALRWTRACLLPHRYGKRTILYRNTRQQDLYASEAYAQKGPTYPPG